MSDKSVFKKHKEPYDEQFTTIPNRVIIDKNITDTAFRFLMYLFSNSDEWKVYMGHTRRLFGWGQAKMECAVNLLITLGYIRRKQVRIKGKFAHYEFEYHHKPIFIGLSEPAIPELPSGDIQPKGGFPCTAKPLTENESLPMPKLPMPNPNGYGGNASSFEDNGNGKPKVMPSTTRKFKRNAEHQQRFEYLMSLGLTDKNGCVSEDEMSYLSHAHSMKKLQDTYCHLEFKMSSQDFKPKSLIAVFKHLLKNEHNARGSNCEANAAYAKQFAKEMGWSSLQIKDKYVEDPCLEGKELPLNMDSMAFFTSLVDMFHSCAGRY